MSSTSHYVCVLNGTNGQQLALGWTLDLECDYSAVVSDNSATMSQFITLDSDGKWYHYASGTGSMSGTAHPRRGKRIATAYADIVPLSQPPASATKPDETEFEVVR